MPKRSAGDGGTHFSLLQDESSPPIKRQEALTSPIKNEGRIDKRKNKNATITPPHPGYHIRGNLLRLALAAFLRRAPLPSMLVPIGALLFIASDVVLSVERFKFNFPLDKQINWALYVGGQIVLAVGVVVGTG